MPYMYILECADSTYYTGSTWHLRQRIKEHNDGVGSRYTIKRLPVTLVYYEKYQRIDEAFNREKQVQGWTKKKKIALISGNSEMLPYLAKKVWKKNNQ